MAVGLPLPTNYSDGDVWSASDVNDITGTINLLGGANFAAGKNRIINGDFFWNQRSFTSNTASGSYNFDRFLQQNSGGTFTLTPQTFTLGTAPVAGYESTNFLRGITATQSAAGDFAIFSQRIENVRTYANTTVTISFFAKANTGTPQIGVELNQNFGSGGSPSAAVSTPAGAVTLSTSWARYSVSVAVPSISGKTLGTSANSSYLELNLWTSSGATNATRASSIGIQNFTADIWGIQVEAGATATAFQTATGTIQGELAACQRYFFSTKFVEIITGYAASTTSTALYIRFPVPMRRTPTGITVVNVGSFNIYNEAGVAGAVLSLTFSNSFINGALFSAATTAGSPTLVAGRGGFLYDAGGISSIFFNGAEL